MKFEQQKAQNWLARASTMLPNLGNIIAQGTTDILIIGAGVFDIYFEQDWIPAFKRKTGDLDLSVGLSTGAQDYNVLRQALINNGYVVENPRIEFRFFSPKKIPGGLTYIDLLAHPVGNQVSSEQTKRIIGVGQQFSFSGFEFALLENLRIQTNLICPNPIAMVGLKLEAYLDHPESRIKDLADIAELAWGIVEKGTHFEMADLWQSIKHHPDASRISSVLRELGSGDSVQWDLDYARQELLRRNFSSSEIDDVIPARLTEWADYLPD